ncbi:hypothetical protein [Stenotrophomonas sp. Iso1]|uniref:hypothetical protein n=1 Tax=Stenotrophomonas sp. Iso1 TaxID=2977283 RepID=UPI0022B792F6|nr:hypothetical protein [Stenotrophomonas sp. Iso1]
MFFLASNLRRGRLVLCSFIALLPLIALPTMAATPLACGSYTEVDGSARFVIESPSHAIRTYEGQPPVRYQIRQQAQVLHVADLSNGFSDDYTVSADGKRIGSKFADYVLDTPARCTTAPTPAAGSCRADIDHCITSAGNASTQQLAQWCREDLPFACERLISAYQSQARAQQPATPDPELEEPDVCKPASPQFDEAACDVAAREALGIAMAKALLGGLTEGAAVPLAGAPLSELLQLCRTHPDASFCNKVAETHWDAGHYASAGEALQLACKAGGDDYTCRRAQGVAAAPAADLATVAATTLPCGDYQASMGLMSELSFGDQGLVSIGMGSALRARLENGAVHIRHDKGGDFVLKPQRNGGLLGVDQWNRYALYQRTGGAATCSAPTVYVELPLPQDCPIGSDAQACCDSGKLAGCNAMGHRNALAGDWQAAAPYYLKLCQAGVRAGCENLRSVYENTGDEDLPGKLLSLCNRDGKRTHVACDVYATTNWALLGLGMQLQRASDEIEAGDAADTPPVKAPAHPRKSTHK